MTLEETGYNSQKTIPAHLVAFALDRIEWHRAYCATEFEYGKGRDAGLKLAAAIVKAILEADQHL